MPAISASTPTPISRLKCWNSRFGPTVQTHELKSGCKINLCLEITGRRPDGYHTLKSYFLPLDEPGDRLLLSFTGAAEPACDISCCTGGIDLKNNTVTKAYRLFAQAVPEVPALHVELIKGVPQGAGLGGGSADAAALLNFLNSHMRKNGHPALGQEKLVELGTRVGADVPFFLVGRPAWVSGIGEIIKPDEAPLAPYKNMHLVLICPSVAVSTLWAFNEWDKLEKSRVNALTEQGRHDSNNSAGAVSFINTLEIPVFVTFPELKRIKEELLALGASWAVMSGSGSSIFGLFASEGAARVAVEVFRKKGPRVFSRPLYTGVSPSW